MAGHSSAPFSNKEQALAKKVLLGLVFVLLGLLGFALGFNSNLLNPSQPKVQVTNSVVIIPEAKNTFAQNLELWFLGQVLPLQAVEAKMTQDKTEASPLLLFLARAVNSLFPWSLNQLGEDDGKFKSNIPSEFSADIEGLFFWNKQKNDAKLNIANPKVAIYSTHSAETYKPFAGVDKTAGKHGGVYVASSVVAEELAKAGIGTIVDDTIHDYPDWNKSYGNSLTTASRLLAENKTVEILIDMHRDAGVSREGSVVEINGTKAARIMFVVGSNSRYKHDKWEENKKLAEALGAKMEEMYPGLLKKISVQTGRYNQHISTKAMLVEMGTTENTMEEIEYSSQMLAKVIAEFLKEQSGAEVLNKSK